ncbi:hypothetical protein [Mariniflexile sp.]|uniref:hypothetical protein n=1 Tax=Mariniflexile sp. TaxID=1979402 RepID=UPI004048A281
MNKETINIKSPRYKLVKIEHVNNLGVYNKFINWIIGEFDLYLKNNESKQLKVYFPNGWFSIGSFKSDNEEICIRIKVEGKSKIACEILMERILNTYSHVVQFYEVKNDSTYLID